jgi:uncharacterized iron-regulated membrane protein
MSFLRVLAPVLQHLGPLHAQEKALTYVLAFAPFALLGFVIWWRHRQAAAEDTAQDRPGGSA